MLHKNAISISKKPMEKSRQATILSKDIVFYHKATAGQTVINLNSLTMPTEINAIQATLQQILSANLYFNKNLKLTSSLGVELMQDLHFKILSGTSIQLIGPYAGFGAEEGEIFRGVMPPLPLTDLIAASSKTVRKGYTLPVGQNLLSLGKEYKVGINTDQPIGSILVYINGSLAKRNTDNSSTVQDGDYYEVLAANGLGSYIYVNTSPATIPHNIVVDFGANVITDVNAFATLDSHAGILKKLADDVAQLAGTDTLDYMIASPSELERLAFGDKVLALESKYDVTTGLSSYTKTKWQLKTLPAHLAASGAVPSLTFNSLSIGKTYRISGQIYGDHNGVANTVNIGLAFYDGDTLVGVCYNKDVSGQEEWSASPNIIFKATSSQMVVNCNRAGGRIFGNGTRSYTYIVLEELPNHEVTTQWT